MSKPATLRDLRQTIWSSPERQSRTVREEMRENLLCRLESDQPIFPGIVGYDDTVVPQLVNAVLSRHHFILLGLRGQAKTRIIRALIELLDEEIPILAGSEVNDSPFAPISKHGRLLLEEHGDDAPIAWVPHSQRYIEKLATPDVTIADIIGDVDPIKAARGKIITPLKDRIGSEIQTHYPRAVDLGMAITAQEAWTERGGRAFRLPDFVAEVVERVAFEARGDKRIDKRSGVSQRLPISVLENVVSNAERRSVLNGEKTIVPRISDVYAAIPAMTGKLELEYEGELQGAETIARDLIRRAAGAAFDERLGGANTDDIVHWFDEGGALKVAHDERSDALLRGLGVVPGLLDLVQHAGLAPRKDPGTLVAACELVLEGLAAQKRIARNEEAGYSRARPERPGPNYPKSGPGGPFA